MPRVTLAIAGVMAASISGGMAVVSYDLARGPGAPHPMPLAAAPKARHEANPWAEWSVTEQLSAHHVLIVHVETRRLDRALSIARTLIDPAVKQEHYAEVLIYFHRPGRPDPFARRRVQWTPRHGYVETVYAP